MRTEGRRREWIDFTISHEDGTEVKLRSRGVALDGDELVFFNNWHDAGGAPIGTRIRTARVRGVTTDGVPRPLNQKES